MSTANKSDKYYFDRGNDCFDRNDWIEAIENYEKAIELDPKYWQAYYNLGLIYNILKQYNEAITSFTEVINLNPDNSDAYNDRGLSYRYLGELKLIELKEEKDSTKKNELAKKAMVNYNKAMENFNKAITLENIRLAKFYNNLGVNCGGGGLIFSTFNKSKEAIGYFNKAKQCFQNSKRFNPNEKNYDYQIKDIEKLIETEMQ